MLTESEKGTLSCGVFLPNLRVTLWSSMMHTLPKGYIRVDNDAYFGAKWPSLGAH